MERIKAIETQYNGLRFRSRLEARWAVFFDKLGIKYQYEPEGFELTNGVRYLPDFYLPESDSFFEVKGIMTDKDMGKINALIENAKRPVTIGYGDFTFCACDVWYDGEFCMSTIEDSVLVKCGKCGKYYFSALQGSYVCLCCGAYDGDRYFEPLRRGTGEDVLGVAREVDNAIDAAKKARFEFDEAEGGNRKLKASKAKLRYSDDISNLGIGFSFKEEAYLRTYAGNTIGDVVANGRKGLITAAKKYETRYGKSHIVELVCLRLLQLYGIDLEGETG